MVVWYRSEYNLDDHSGHQIGRKEKIIMFSSSTLSLAAAHHPFTISGPATTFTDTKLQEQAKVGGGEGGLADWDCMKRFRLNEIV